MTTIDLPETATWDAVTAPRVHGADPGAEVTIRAETDAWFDGSGSAQATFVADDGGDVDPTDQAPVRGDYDGVAPMGWLWALHHERVGDATPTGDAADVTVTVEAHVDGERRASTTITRRRAGCRPRARDDRRRRRRPVHARWRRDWRREP